MLVQCAIADTRSSQANNRLCVQKFHKLEKKTKPSIIALYFEFYVSGVKVNFLKGLIFANFPWLFETRISKFLASFFYVARTWKMQGHEKSLLTDCKNKRYISWLHKKHACKSLYFVIFQKIVQEIIWWRSWFWFRNATCLEFVQETPNAINHVIARLVWIEESSHQYRFW